MQGVVVASRARLGWLVVLACSYCVIAVVAAGSPAARASARLMRPASVTAITIDARRAGPVFGGIGAISGGGGNSRLLIDYPAWQRNQILDYLFGPGGADLQLLKLEIGGDANSSDGSEPSVEHSKGQVDCRSGYEWWLAEQAVARNPRLKLYGLQWAAPGWVGSVWSQADVGYVLDWLNCARSHGLAISYLGGWNENGYNQAWYESLRRALDAGGFGSVQILADDAHPPPGPPYKPASAWQVASAAASDPVFKAALAVIGVHDTCGGVTTGFRCESTRTARQTGLPLWESELGAMDANKGAAAMVRSINNGFIQARITGYLEWPLIDSMAPGLPYENRGLVTADQPASGHYRVNKMTWAIAQTTQFTAPGWRYAGGASTELGGSGSATAYLAPGGRGWSLVAENTGHFSGQAVRPQTIRVRLTGGLDDSRVHVWATDLVSSDRARWFSRQPDLHPVGGEYTYTIPPGEVVSFTTTGGQSHRRTAVPGAGPQRLPYQATADASNEAWGLGSQEGAFLYAPCLAGAGGQCIEQLAGQLPVWWRPPVTSFVPHPYAVVGARRWSGYTVSADVLFTTDAGMAGLIGRFSAQNAATKQFNGYELRLTASGRWQLTRQSRSGHVRELASGAASRVSAGTWHALALGLHRGTITARVDGRLLARVTDHAYQFGLAGIASNWTRVQFRALRVK
jgi:glycosyl hydrolase family 59/glycosyl hydrolase family 59 (putative galactocerebrosidase)